MEGNFFATPSFSEHVKAIIRKNISNEDFGVEELTREMGMSRFSLNRKLHLFCGKTINRYIREFRLQLAKEMLEQEMHTVSEVSFKVGFSSPAYFNTCFSDYFGFPPGEIKKRSLNSEIDRSQASQASMIISNQKLPLNKSGFILKYHAWKIAAMVVFITVFFVGRNSLPTPGVDKNINLPRELQPTIHARSIAVLPFRNDSHDPDNEYLINGVMEAILDNLAKIKDLEVRPRTSVEIYRNERTKTTPQIARELGVSYIIEGSGQKIGDHVNLFVQLIEAESDKHILSSHYNKKPDDIFSFQSDVAIEVASEIQACITAGERKAIRNIPTRNPEAMNLYLQANDLHKIAESEKNHELNCKAEILYKRAIQLDSAYADPITALGWILSERNMDSALYLANKALHFDPENPDAFNLKGFASWYKGMDTQAEDAYRQSIKYKPNNSAAYSGLGDLYFYQGSCALAIENQLLAFHLENNLSQQLKNVESFSSNLYSLGFYAEAAKYASRLLELNNDSTNFYWGLVTVDLDLGNYTSAVEKANKMYRFDPENPDNIYRLLYTYLYLRDFKKAGSLMQQYINAAKRQGRVIEPDYLLGFACLENGQKQEADFHFNGVISKMKKMLKSGEPTVRCRAYITLAKIYSAQNDKAAALLNLRKFSETMGSTILRIKDFKNCTMLDNIRSEPEFESYLKVAESRYHNEHEKVAGLLRKEGILASSMK